MNTTKSTGNYNNILKGSSTIPIGCCVPGNRIIKVYDDEETKKGEEMTMIRLSTIFHEDDEYFVDSFDQKLGEDVRKKIIHVTRRPYKNGMIRLVFDFENEIYFECTEDHKIPMIIEDEFYLGKANTISPWTKLFFFEKGKIVQRKVKGVITYDTPKEIEVFNLALDSNNNRDCFYIDVQTNLIHHC